MTEENPPEHPLHTDFFTHQAEATHSPYYKQPPIMIVLIVVGIGVLFGLFKLVDYALNFDKLAAMKSVQVNFHHPKQTNGLAFIDVEVINYNPAPVKDVTLRYDIIDGTGNSLKDGEIVLPGSIPAADSRVFPSIPMGSISRVSGKMQSELTNLKYGPKPTLTPELTHQFIELAAAKPKDSLASWTSFVKAAPEFPIGYIRLGHSLAANDDLDNAIKSYEKALRMDPDDANAHYCLGIAYVYKKDNARAKKEFEAATQLDPDDPAAKESLKRMATLSP